MTPALAGITHRVANFVRQYLWPRVHVVLDLHSGGDVARFVLCANYHRVEDPQQAAKIEETARWFGTPALMVYQNLTPGLLTSEAERLGKIAVGTELGWGRAVLTEGVRYGRQGVLAAAIHEGQLRGTIEPIAYHRAGTQMKLEMIDRECFTVAPFAGHYEPLVDCGTASNVATRLACCMTSITSIWTPGPRRLASMARCWPRPGFRRCRAVSTLWSWGANCHEPANDPA